MANSISALKWLNGNRGRYGIRVCQLEWPRDLVTATLYDYEISIQHGGCAHIGRGVDTVESTAVVKALAESLERLHCHEHRIRTSGVAAHLTMAQAREQSLLELFEHDMLLCHLITGMASAPMEIPVVLSPFWKTFANRGIELQLFPLRGWCDLYVMLAIARHKSHAIALGLGCSVDEKLAIQKAVLEMLPNAANFLTTGQSAFSQLQPWLTAASSRAVRQSPSIQSVRVSSFMLSSEIETPFFVVRSTSTELQKYLGDGWSEFDLNGGRLMSFAESSWQQPEFILGKRLI